MSESRPEHPKRFVSESDSNLRRALARLSCERGDITGVDVDAIGNAANAELAGGGGVDGAIHRAAGPGMMRELTERYPRGCSTGECVITAGYDLPARFVLHCVGPIWRGGDHGESAQLASTYRSALALAESVGATTLAFPAISAGIYGYPHRPSADVALSALALDLASRPSIESVRMILFSEELHRIYSTALAELARTISAS